MARITRVSVMCLTATMNAMARDSNNKAPASADEALNIDYNARNVAASLAPELALKAS